MIRTKAHHRRWITLAAATLAAGCGLGSAAAPVSGHPGTLAAGVCRDVEQDARCATLTVYENRQAASGRLIPLRIIVLPATGPDRAPDPIFFLAGGPGQAATTLVNHMAGPRARLGAARDLVFVDQRGTGGSNALTCPFYGPPDDPASYFDRFLPPARVRACRERLERVADLTQYTTANAVGDLDQVRAALGYDRINLVGGSYGTRLAMEYVRRYEPRVRSVILDGPVPVTTRMPEDFGRTAQQALDALLDECARNERCRAAFPSIREKARAVFARLAQAPGRATVRHPGSRRAGEVVLTREHVAEAIRYMTYSSQHAGRVPMYLDAAFRGDYAPIAQFLLRHRASGTFDGLYLSITCAEDVPFLAADAESRDEATYLGTYRLREQRAACAEWRRGPAPEWHERPVASRVPVLILAGALDPVTTPRHGAEVGQSLPASLLVTVPFGGHSPAGLTGLECIAALKHTFLQRGTVDGLDTSCVANITRPGFELRTLKFER